jgi:DNA polymerase-3 subunit alpha
VVGGIVGPMRRQGDSRMFVRLEDGGGQVEVSLYGEALQNFAALMIRDALLVVEGRLGYDNFSGGYQIRARQVWTLEQACAEHARLLRLRLDGPDGGFVRSLRDVLAAHRGATPVLLAGYRNDDASVDLELSADWRVRATPQLKRTLETLPGIAAADLLLSRPTAG